jgi:fatty-acyl-CoA synthase
MWLGFGSAIKHWGKYQPDKTALIVGSAEISYKTLNDKAVSISNYFCRTESKGRIAILLKDKFKYIASISGLNLINIPVIILNPYLQIESLNINLTDATPDFIIVESETKSLLEKTNIFGGKIVNIDEIPVNSDFNYSIRIPNKEWGILFSSGSTGTSKAILYEHQTMLSELLAWILELSIIRKSVFYIGRPICYTGGLVLTLATLLVGGTAILNLPNIDNDFIMIWTHYQNCLQKYKIDFAFFVPDQIRQFIKVAKNNLGGPTILVMGSSILPDEKKKANKILKSPIIESWGNTEGLGTITEIQDLEKRPGSIGRPFLTEEILVLSEDLEICQHGNRGRLAGSDETMFVEYANRPDATERVKRNNFILSDDIGYMDSDNYFYVEGRVQESFIVKGKTVFIVDIENRIREIPGIIENCVIVDEYDKKPIFFALVVAEPSKKENLEREIRKRINIDFGQIFYSDRLPRLASGKIDRLSAKNQILKNYEK